MVAICQIFLRNLVFQLKYLVFRFENDFFTAQEMKFSNKDFFSKCDQICSFLGIWSHLLKKSLMENFIFVQCSIKIPSFNEKLSLLKILHFQMTDSCSRSGNQILILAHAEDPWTEQPNQNKSEITFWQEALIPNDGRNPRILKGHLNNKNSTIPKMFTNRGPLVNQRSS